MAKQKPTFFEVSSYTGSLREGNEINVQRHITYWGERADFKPFLKVPIKELERRLKASKAEEKKVYDKLQEAAKAWDEHGAQTLLLEKAIGYLKVPEVKHTNNEWKKQKDGSWEISNMVYKMTFSVVKFGDEWKLSWEIQYTAPGKTQERYYSYYDSGPKKRIDHESSKKYKTLDGAQKYIQMKFDQYASYFASVSPPIPPEAKELFCFNGQLLQGYTVARPEAKKKEATVADLLDCLDDGDIHPQKAAATPTASPVTKPTEKTSASKVTAGAKKEAAPKIKPPKGSNAKKKPLHKKKSAPAR